MRLRRSLLTITVLMRSVAPIKKGLSEADKAKQNKDYAETVLSDANGIMQIEMKDELQPADRTIQPGPYSQKYGWNRHYCVWHR